jgi:hypothetical protein
MKWCTALQESHAGLVSGVTSSFEGGSDVAAELCSRFLPDSRSLLQVMGGKPVDRMARDAHALWKRCPGPREPHLVRHIVEMWWNTGHVGKFHWTSELILAALLKMGCSFRVCILNRQNNNKFWEELIAYFPWYDTGHIENDASNNSSIVACVFVTEVTFLPSRCLATIRGFLPSRCLATIWRNTQTHTQQRDLISVFYFFQNKGNRLKN